MTQASVLLDLLNCHTSDCSQKTTSLGHQGLAILQFALMLARVRIDCACVCVLVCCIVLGRTLLRYCCGHRPFEEGSDIF